MADNLRDRGYPGTHTDPKFASRKANYVDGSASIQRTEPLGVYPRGTVEDLDDNRQQDYVNAVLNAVKSPLNVQRWNTRLEIDMPWQDTLQKGYALKQGDTRLGMAERVHDPYGRGTSYYAAIDNLEPIFGDGYSWNEKQTLFGNFGIGYEDGTAAVEYSTPGLAQQMYYINALKNLLNRGR